MHRKCIRANLQFGCIAELQLALLVEARLLVLVGLLGTTLALPCQAGRPHATSKRRKLLTDPSDWPAFIIYLLFLKG